MENEITLSNENGSWQTMSTKKWQQRKSYKAENPKEIRAAIPGKIVRVLEEAREGNKVKAGTPLLELEAMKMVNTLTAPIDGEIKEIAVTEGSEVGKSELLISFA